MESVNFLLVNGDKSVVNVAQGKQYRLSANCKGAYLRFVGSQFLRKQEKQGTHGCPMRQTFVVFDVALKVSGCKHDVLCPYVTVVSL